MTGSMDRRLHRASHVTDQRCDKPRGCRHQRRYRNRYRDRDRPSPVQASARTQVDAPIAISIPISIPISIVRRSRAPSSLRLGALIMVLLLLPIAGCEKAMQNMYQQPKYSPLEPSRLFPNGNSSRTPPDASLAIRTGGLAESSGGRRGAQVPLPESNAPLYPIIEQSSTAQQSSGSSDTGTSPWMPDLNGLPIEVTAATYRRGEERFDIFCAPCHGPTGAGDGMVVQRGFPAPPTYHTDRLRTAPNRHFYQVITQGYGAMYSYADRLPRQDRWAIVAYIRALQLSRHAPARLLAAAERRRLEPTDE